MHSKVSTVCKNYFQGFHNLLDFKNNDIKKNALSTAIVLSYFSVIIPLIFAITYSIDSLHGRVSKKNTLTPDEEKVTFVANNTDMTRSLSDKLTDQKIDQSIEKQIASINDDQIKGIATVIIADVMDRLSIDIQQTHTPLYAVLEENSNECEGTSFVKAKHFNKESSLMKYLLPVCTPIIKESFNNPAEFINSEIVFDFVKEDKLGLLDNVKDKNLKQKISDGMSTYSTLTMTVKVYLNNRNLLVFEIKEFLNGNWSSTKTSSVEDLIETAKTGLI